MLELTCRDLYFPHLPAGLEGLTVLHVGDLHCRGFGAQERRLRTILQEGADLVLCSGDFCFQWGFSNPLVKTANLRTHDVGLSWKGFSCPPNLAVVKEVVGKLFAKVHAPLGVYAIQGNHDPDAFLPSLVDLGIRVLANKTVQVEAGGGARFNLFGVRSFERAHMDLPATLLGMDRDLFTLGSCHYPEMAEPLAAAGVDLNLAGHTHGGQVCWPGGRAIITHSLTGKKYVSGLNWIGSQAVYTTRGIGCSAIPVRLFCPSEIVRFTLRRGSSV